MEQNQINNQKNPMCAIPASMIPSWNVEQAFRKGTQKKFLIKTWGGLGDQVCAEPAIRFALKAFPQCEISLASEAPELFTHLHFKEVFDLKKVRPIFENYMTFESIVPPTHLMWEFLSHMLSHCVDFPSVCMFRCQLPNSEKEIKLPDYQVASDGVRQALDLGKRAVMIHAGRHWQSKTFPIAWWESVVAAFKKADFEVILIGKNVDENVGYVEISGEGCIDLRDKLLLSDLIALLKGCEFLFSNDSSPMHIAAAGNAFIGFVASCKHPDYITHWRNGQFGHKMKNFGRDGLWNYIDHSPVQECEVKAEELPSGLMDKILPSPEDIVSHYLALRGL
ncbi:MAG: hypothetical protein IPK68_08925 [Bdellovibrionales bacterium]|nr:hypothetical protein [Bdellovibrionales bacterium]